jgi:FixJ family two-component response regulator
MNAISAPDTRALAVWLLDDDPSVLKATSRLLSSAGWKVEPFLDPCVFLKQAEIHHPRVAVLDILMPAMGGLEVLDRLRIISPSTRVIILTSKDNPSVRVRAIETGASAFFLKPVDHNEFIAAIEEVVFR